MAINVAEMTSRIQQSGIQKRIDEAKKHQQMVDGIVAKVKMIKKQFTEDAKALCEIYKALKNAGLNEQGPKRSYYDVRGKFMADGISHKVGFIEYKDGTVCLCVKGGGWDGNDSLLFMRKGESVECADECCNDIFGEACSILKMPLGTKLHGFTVLDELWIKHYSDRVNTFVNGFVAFRDEYLEYVNSKTQTK